MLSRAKAAFYSTSLILPQTVRSEGEMENPRKTYAHPFCFPPPLFFSFLLLTSLTLSSIQYPRSALSYPLLQSKLQNSHGRSTGVISAIYFLQNIPRLTHCLFLFFYVLSINLSSFIIQATSSREITFLPQSR